MGLGRFQGPSASDIASGLVPVPPPIKQSDVSAVRTNYGVAADFKPKGQSSQSLYDHSVKFVLDWWKKNNPANAPVAPPVTPGASGGGTAGSGGGAASSGGGLTSGAAHPVTTTGAGPQATAGSAPTSSAPPAALLKDTGTPPSSYLAPNAGANPLLTAGPAQTKAVTGISGVVSKATAQSILTQMGVKGLTPPSSALTSTTALRAWANAQLAKQKTQQTYAVQHGRLEKQA